MKTIALIGQPNVGKSTLFNKLTQTRDALVYDFPGVTRDRQYGFFDIEANRYLLVDTGGIGGTIDILAEEVQAQTRAAIEEADLILFLVDYKMGATVADFSIADQLRKIAKPIYVVVNKAECDEAIACNEFYQLGFSSLFSLSAMHNRGFPSLLQAIAMHFPSPQLMEMINISEEHEDIASLPEKAIKVAFVGRPNAGKSTLTNRILGENRVIVSDQAGTTRDSVYIPFTHQTDHFILIDTAGIRRRRRVDTPLEKFSVIKTLQAIHDCHVAILVIDAHEGSIVDQDLHLLAAILEAGKALVIAVNKWDNLTVDDKNHLKQELDRKLQFVNFAQIKPISALHGTGVGDLYRLIKKAYRSAFITLKTSEVNTLLEKILHKNPPAMIGNRRAKFRYAHMGGHNPPQIVIHGTHLNAVPKHYVRYLSNAFREALKLEGTPLVIKFSESE